MASKSKKRTRKASHLLPDPVRSVLSGLSTKSLLGLQDFRLMPEMDWATPAKLFSGAVASVIASEPAKGKKKGRLGVPYQIAFAQPKQTLVCVRRNARKQVLHAKRKTGKGGQRRPRKTRFRNIKC